MHKTIQQLKVKIIIIFVHVINTWLSSTKSVNTIDNHSAGKAVP